ncbi:MAG: FAD-dependent oxidoreductase [Acidimicrobiia bacterium]|nr:FAD-dependent oxidoreductase [Acidimicrobiia bacterium]
MAKIIIVGDGPGGLSAALFLAKNGQEVTVYGQDQTAMNYAHLYNYLGLPEISGSDFQAIARSQVTAQGGSIVDAEVTAIAAAGDVYEVTLADGSTNSAGYLVMNEGRNPQLVTSLDVDVDGDGAIVVNSHGLSSVARVYVVGRSVRPARSQAIITAGDGAAAAIDILSREKGEDVQDWDSPPKD